MRDQSVAPQWIRIMTAPGNTSVDSSIEAATTTGIPCYSYSPLDDLTSAPKSFDRSSQVAAGRHLIAGAEVIGAVDVWPRQEGRQNLASLAPKEKAGHPRILLTHLSLVLIEPLDRRAENREVHVHQKRRVRRSWRRVVLRRHNELMDSLGHRVRHPLLAGRISRPRRTLLFVVLTADLVHGVVKPQRQFDFVDLVGKVPPLIEVSETFVQVLERVVAAMRFRVSSPDDGVEISRLDPEPLPRRSPPFDIRHIASCAR